MATIVRTLLFLLAFSTPGFADERCPPPTPAPAPAPANVSYGGSNHNAIAIAAVIGIGICIYHKCWQPKPVKAEASLVPEIPQNEYLRIRSR